MTDPTPNPIPCPVCDGRGYHSRTVPIYRRGNNGFINIFRRVERSGCPMCQGTGTGTQKQADWMAALIKTVEQHD